MNLIKNQPKIHFNGMVQFVLKSNEKQLRLIMAFQTHVHVPFVLLIPNFGEIQ